MVAIVNCEGRIKSIPIIGDEFSNPPSINSMYKCDSESNMRITSRYTNWLDANKVRMAEIYRNDIIDYKTPVKLTVFSHLERINDLDNIIKAIPDLLEKSGLVPNDRYFDKHDYERCIYVSFGHFRVVFEKMDETVILTPKNDPFDYGATSWFDDVVIPDGVYQAMVTGSVLMPDYEQKNKYLIVTLRVCAGQYSGYRLQDHIHLSSENEDERRLSIIRFKQLVESAGFPFEELKDTEYLEGTPISVVLSTETRVLDNKPRKRNKVVRYEI